ncbi:Tyrosyl-DNA phosphodiesterase 2 [Rhynchospora pubera]|uniref:Tyrosyl-DNA phosphodiesterase 2 n=2 Tax=Rhynchospora pubera TaxID=906938 RepID=A0AAV8GQY9_9POAL|nr:Tyrosyl-DNA phosphodiesterase 2 [Rhynchospora pubera]
MFAFSINLKFKTLFSRSLSLSRTVMASPWACARCTFLNPPSSNPISCKICLSPFSSSSSSPSPSSSSMASTNWSCHACTFSNKPSSLSCEICETQKETKLKNPISSFSNFGLDQDELSDPSVGKVFLPLQQCTGRKRQAPSPSLEKPKDSVSGEGKDFSLKPCGSRSKRIELASGENTDGSSNKHKVTVMSYNVWFREDLELEKRMEALGELIQLFKPDLMCFQEVTPNIYGIFESSIWWKEYKCSVPRQLAEERPYFCMLLSKLPVKAFSSTPFSNSVMGRELCKAEITLPDGKTLVIATTHLESPCPAPPTWNQMYSKERVAQAQQSVNLLEASPNTIFAGDMNWDDKTDGPFPLTKSWTDAWTQLRPDEEGFTYDTKLNPMLNGNRSLRKRLDRFLVNSTDFEVTAIEMIGRDAIPGVKHFKDKKVKKEVKRLELPVLPSDHFGLLLTLCRK